MSPTAFTPWTRALLLAALTGCAGAVEGPAGTRDDGRGPQVTEDGGIPKDVPSSLTACKDLNTIDVAPATMRRISHTEYDNTLHDLGIVAAGDSPGSALAGDVSIGASKDRGFAVGGPVDDTLALDLVNSSMAIAASAADNLPKLMGCTPSGAAEEAACAKTFINDMGLRIFRRPLTSDEKNALNALYADVRGDFDHRAGVEAVLASLLTAPEFIYLFENEPEDANDGDVVPLDGWAMASRLSYFLWDSTPDKALLDAAAAEALQTPEQIAEQATRMLADPKAKRAVASFFSQWSMSRTLDGLATDDPAFTKATAAALRGSIDRTFEDAFFGDDGTLANLFDSTDAFVSDAIAPLFGVEANMGSDLVPTALDAEERRGILTHPALLAVNAKGTRGDPIHRGLFVREKLLCMTLPQPPAADADGNPINLVVPPAEPGQTDRDRFAAHTERTECSGCHSLLDPIGFGFGNYDGFGRFRTRNQFDEEIDASGEVFAGGDISGAFNGAVDLAENMSTSDTVADCMGIQWFRFALDRKESKTSDVCSNATTLKAFQEGRGTLQDLVLGVVQSAGFRYRKVGGVIQ